MAISRSQKQGIERVTTQLLSKVPATLPVDLDAIAEVLQLRIERFPFPNEISGLLKKELRVIGVNETHPERRQRFTLAHEIGHYVLGHNITNDEDFVDDLKTDSTSTTEREANYFASVLLMPEEAVKKTSRGGIDLKKMADTFAVSEQAMTIRLLEIGLI